jgi:hypothetical protein
MSAPLSFTASATGAGAGGLATSADAGGWALGALEGALGAGRGPSCESGPDGALGISPLCVSERLRFDERRNAPPTSEAITRPPRASFATRATLPAARDRGRRAGRRRGRARRRERGPAPGAWSVVSSSSPESGSGSATIVGAGGAEGLAILSLRGVLVGSGSGGALAGSGSGRGAGSLEGGGGKTDSTRLPCPDSSAWAIARSKSAGGSDTRSPASLQNCGGLLRTAAGAGVFGSATTGCARAGLGARAFEDGSGNALGTGVGESGGGVGSGPS